MRCKAFIAYWNKNTIGDYIKVHWTEVDGGERDVITISLTMPRSESFPIDTKVEFKLRKLDDDLGHQMVQFTDPETQKYGTGLIEWYMKNN